MLPKAVILLIEANNLFKAAKKDKKIFDSEEFKTNVEKLRMIFPNQRLNSGLQARDNPSDVKKKMVEFFINYPEYYDWELVFSAAKDYVDAYSQEVNYGFMKTCKYFIHKEKEGSQLASFCENVKNGVRTQITEDMFYKVI